MSVVSCWTLNFKGWTSLLVKVMFRVVGELLPCCDISRMSSTSTGSQLALRECNGLNLQLFPEKPTHLYECTIALSCMFLGVSSKAPCGLIRSDGYKSSGYYMVLLASLQHQ